MPTDELASERAHLTSSREHLARMRARAASMDSSAAADWVSRMLLDSAQGRRLKALEDDPTVPLFFGRLDYADGHPEAGRPFYIGRRHVSDESGDPMVVDWRAPISLPFYRASTRDALGVATRRRFGFQHGRVTAFEDERLSGGDAVTESDEHWSRILEEEIERPRVGPMRDIVATIQPEQDVIVRADLSESICVQGAPGTGKTAVGLHRAAYLLYAYREQLRRQGVLVVGPNESFLRYIGDVLPALGEIEAQQTTIEQLAGATLSGVRATYTIRGEDPADVATLKGDARLAEVVRRAVWSHLTAPAEGLVVPRGARRWRVPTYRVEEIVAELRGRGVRYGAARAMLPQRLAHAILLAMEEAGDSPDDRVQDAVARSQPVKKYAAAVWPAVDPAKLVHRLLSDAQFLASCADGLLDEDEQRRLLWTKPARAAGSVRWSLADAVLVDEAADVVERTASLGHVVTDEAQDLSPMMLRAVGRRATTGSVTVLGDLAQATTPWATRSWLESLRHLGKDAAHVEELTKGFRVPGEVIEYAARLLPHIAPGLRPPTSVRRARGELDLQEVADPVAAVGDAVASALTRPGSVGVITPDALVRDVAEALRVHGTPHTVLGAAPATEPVPATPADTTAAPAPTIPAPTAPTEPPTAPRTEVVPATLAKGLEFDHVVLVEPATIVSAEPDRVTGLRRLYVCLTRAVTSLVVLHAEPLPEEVAA
ncbi:AAA family ATPase [Nocardioides sp. HDW12B]|uniref:HelD family protein n=1 Tax=Nocardioides sp. HDW12B TaxID=2714939 RepID=UPI001409CFAE|nr:AAA family ATPase [Nocardioides sp. HDW12B]QIK65214.1 AAA family ATPase [Nocardioides sp. HDW12B]